MAPFRQDIKADHSALAVHAGGVGAMPASPSATSGTLAVAQSPHQTQQSQQSQPQMSMPAQGPQAPQNVGQLQSTKRKQASVVEMLEYVKGLDIDPIKESDMLWIAEEAFNAALPPGWTEHEDEEGRVYFHNGNTGESVWRHPMDDLFKKIVEYQRRVQKTGGFHEVEDELEEDEENIRGDLAEWMELFDEHGEKFFYNRRTDDSRFDDPRMNVYHCLYAKIKMVAKMKERLPVLARAPRPEEPTKQELELRRRQEEEEDKYLKCLVKVQAAARVILAKRAYRIKQSQATVQKGPQPLKGKLRLRIEKPKEGHGEAELVLRTTTPHRRNRAATKVQARMRGVLTRKHYRPLVIHRAFLSKIVTKIQTRARVWLAKRKAIRMRQARVHKAATDVQRAWRGHRDRAYVGTLKGQKSRYEQTVRATIFIQRRIRMMLKRKKMGAELQIKYTRVSLVLQRQIRVDLARRSMQNANYTQRPVQALFFPTPDPKVAGMIPWSWQLQIAPWLGDEENSWAPGCGQFENVFSKVAATEDRAKDIAAGKIQSLARGASGRRRVRVLRQVAADFFEALDYRLWDDVETRMKAAARMQGGRRMNMTQKTGLIAEKKNEHIKACAPFIALIEAQFLKFSTQAWLMDAMGDDFRQCAAERIQAMWRGYLARRHREHLEMEALWPLKSWFGFTATGRDAVQAEVKFVANPSFNDYRYFVVNGPSKTVALTNSMEELNAQLAESVSMIEDILGGPLPPPPGSQLDSESQMGRRMSAKSAKDEEASDMASQKSGGSRKSSRQSRSKGTSSRLGSKAQKEEAIVEEVMDRTATHMTAEASVKHRASAAGIERPDSRESIHKAEELEQPEGAEGGQPSGDEASGEDGRKGPGKKKSPKSRPGLVPETPGAAALAVLGNAHRGYEDRVPARHPDDAHFGRSGKQAKLGDSMSKTQGLNASQSEGALDGKKKAVARTSYGGTVKGGSFIRNGAGTVDELTDDHKQLILDDLEKKKRDKMGFLAQKKKERASKMDQEEKSKRDKFKAQMSEAEEGELERQKKREKEMKKWLKQKEDETRSRKAKENEIINAVKEKELAKADNVKKVEQNMKDQREKRMAIAEKQRGKLETQLLMSKGVVPKSMLPPELQKQVAPQQQAEPGRGPLRQQKMMHRHVHHHVHYHDPNEDENGMQGPGDVDTNQMEYHSEADVMQQAAGGAGVPPGGLPIIDSGAETQDMRRAASMPYLQNSQVDSMGMTRTQEVFRNQSQSHVPGYHRGLERATGAYADSGRPRRSGQAF